MSSSDLSTRVAALGHPELDWAIVFYTNVCGEFGQLTFGAVVYFQLVFSNIV